MKPYAIKILLLITVFLCIQNVWANDAHEIKVESTSEGAVNIRKGPGTEYAVVGQLQPGEWMLVNGEPNLEKEWVKASKMGVSGYVNTRYLRILEESHALQSYDGLNFFPVPSFMPKLKLWAWNLIVIFLSLFIVLWIVIAIIGKSESSFLSSLSLAGTTCIIWYTVSLGNDAFWFADPDVSGGWMWTIFYCAIFLILGFLYIYSSCFLIADGNEDLDDFADWVGATCGLCIYLIAAAVAKLWIDWVIWIGYIALGIGIIMQCYKILTSSGFTNSLLFLYTCIGIYIILEPFLYVLAIAAIFGLFAIVFLKGSTNGSSNYSGSSQVQYVIEGEYGKTITVTCSKYSPDSGYGDDGNRYERLPNGKWRRV